MKLFIIFFIIFVTKTLGENFYDILNISKQATDREIRKAFKKKALELHPDKNQDDPDAQSKFIKLNRAYEVLKDDELRKKYDLYGEEGLDKSRSQGSNYHSWSYYHDNFGIYDDDVEIITLNNADFEQSVLRSEDIWFINFYHPMCSHCHTLAPVWRQLAQELDGVIRIGAVNCDDTYHVCSTQGIRSYPTLMAYPGMVRFPGEKSKEHLLSFIIERLNQNPVVSLTKSNWKGKLKGCPDKPWVILSKSGDDEEDDFTITKIKLGAIFEGMICLGEVDCLSSENICSTLKFSAKIKFYGNIKRLLEGDGETVHATNPQEIAKEVLALLLDIPILSTYEYKEIQRKLVNREDAVPWLILFSNENDENNLEIRKLPALLQSVSLGQVLCQDMRRECDDLYILKTPAFALFKLGGGYELHQGRVLAHDIAVFAREGALATQFQILTPKEFPQVLNDGSPWFVDFYAPWCPPCMKLLPEFKKASRLLDVPVKFGSIDCTTHSSLCQEYNIRQYPTTILYNKSVAHQYHGHHMASNLVDFVMDTINPTVIVLDDEIFQLKVGRKKRNELWVVDFYANWCHHCIEMAPEYRRFARLVSDIPNVHVAQIDCALYRHICQQEGIHGYPTVVLYPFGDVANSVQYNGWTRDAKSFRQWLTPFLPSKVTNLDDRTFEEMLRSEEPWLVDFFAPWCGHCHEFAPEFEDIANKLDGAVRCGKVNCESYHWLCRGAGVRAYPTVKFYEGATKGIERQNAVGEELGTTSKSEILFKLRKYNNRQSNQLHNNNDNNNHHDEL